MEMEHRGRLNTQAMVLIVFLVVQYVLGMAANLFVQFPQNADAGELWGFAWSQALVAAHIVIGTLMVIGAIVLVVRSLIRKNRSWIVFSIIGLLAILAAALTGATFISTQSDAYSYSMSLAFIVALAAYGWGVYSQWVSAPGVSHGT
jgi:heme A synthase